VLQWGMANRQSHSGSESGLYRIVCEGSCAHDAKLMTIFMRIVLGQAGARYAHCLAPNPGLLHGLHCSFNGSHCIWVNSLEYRTGWGMQLVIWILATVKKKTKFFGKFGFCHCFFQFTEKQLILQCLLSGKSTTRLRISFQANLGWTKLVWSM